MSYIKIGLKLISHPKVCLGLLLLTLASCGSSSDEDKIGYLKFYNASANAPGVFVTVDEDLDDDDDDEVEVTYSAVAYGNVSATNSLDKDEYYVELGYQVDESTDRDDLELIYQEQLQILKDQISFVVLTGDIRSPEVLVYEIKVVDDDNDVDDDLFNVRLLNLSTDATYSGLDLYMSKDNETFNEATLIGTVYAKELSDNIKLSQAEYIYYITLAGSSEVLYTSAEVTYSSVNQYIIIIRDNAGVGSSPFSVDSIGTNGVTKLDDVNSEAQFTFYNAIALDLIDGSLPDYQGVVSVDVKRNKSTDIVFDNLAMGQFSELTTTSNGDYTYSVRNPSNNKLYLSGALLTLVDNADNSIFLYGQKTAVDDDNDGNVDENEDGIVDAYETKIKSLIVTNSNSASVYSHTMKIVNLVDSDDFSRAKFYFVQNDETIATASYNASVLQEKTGSMALINNTYDVYVVATIDSTELILDTYYLVLDEDSKDQFLIFEADQMAPSGYKMVFIDQASDN
jgi:hypothetical protein